MKIALVHPDLAGARSGNLATAERWERLLTELGHEVERSPASAALADGEGAAADLLIALHATKSAATVAAWKRRRPGAPVVVALGGTDLYLDLPDSPAARAAVAAADRLVVLQPLALASLPAAARKKARVIYQSVRPPAGGRPEPGASDPADFDVAFLAHLRPVKDPLTAIAAARLLPASSPVRIRHAGAGLDPALAAAARAASGEVAAYEWLGSLPREGARALLAASRLLLLASRTEGGANVVSEAIAAGVPVVASRIPGSVGLLGGDWPAYFAVGDAGGLAALLARAATEPGFYAELIERVAALRPLVDPAREREAWRSLLAEIV